MIIVDLADKKPRLRGHPLAGFDLRPRRGFGHPGAKSVALLPQACPAVGRASDAGTIIFITSI